MIIKRIELRNIRSYREASVELPRGKTLFAGDIGSGKSTLLMAIEFGFFGLGSETGASLLRVGEEEGSVKMVFEVDGREYEVLRRLVKRGERVQQTKGELRTPDARVELSPTELKERILDILQFNEVPDPNAQSRIYRYAIYTPQEDMKSILMLSPDLRLQTLRRAFGIESYKVAIENTAELSREIRSRAREFEALARDADEIRDRVKKLRAQSESDRERLGELAAREVVLAREVEGLKDRSNKLRDDQVRLETVTKELAMHIDRLRRLEKDIAEWMEEADEGARKRSRLEHRIVELQKVESPTEKADSQLRLEIRALEERKERLVSVLAKIETKIGDYQSIMEKGVCPVCDRPVEAHEFVEKRLSKQGEREHATEENDECASKLAEARGLLERRREYDSTAEKLRDLREESEGLGREETTRKQRLAQGREELESTKRKIEEGKATLGKLGDVSSRIEDLGWKTKSAERELQDIRGDLAGTRTRIDERATRIEEGEAELRSKEEHARKAGVLKEHDIWLQDYFGPALEAIERQVMLSINQDFNADLQRWFGVLINDPAKEVRVDENFTPIISQDGFEQEVQFLSGGEKTSVSLAYRLALNTLVQRVTSGMKSNLLILDEPTDGFSKEQLGNVREILDEIACPQMVIVSHERELESFADQIYRVVKSGGISRVLGGGHQEL